MLTVARVVARNPELNVPLAKLRGTTLLNIDCKKKENRCHKKVYFRNVLSRRFQMFRDLTNTTLCEA